MKFCNKYLYQKFCPHLSFRIGIDFLGVLNSSPGVVHEKKKMYNASNQLPKVNMFSGYFFKEEGTRSKITFHLLSCTARRESR